MSNLAKIVVIGLVLVSCLTVTADAQFLGRLRSAQTSGLGSLNLQAGAGVYEDAFNLMGRVRYGMASSMDATFSLALVDPDGSDDLEVLLGGDLQYQISHYDLGKSLDIALGGFLTYYSMEKNDYSDLAVGMDVTAGRPIDLSTGFSFTPYGRLNLRVDNVEVKDKSDSEFNIGFNLGVVVPLSGYVDLSGEAQLDDQFGFAVGINFLMW